MPGTHGLLVNMCSMNEIIKREQLALYVTPGRCPRNNLYGMGEIVKLIICLLLATRPFGGPTKDNREERDKLQGIEDQFLTQRGTQWKN